MVGQTVSETCGEDDSEWVGIDGLGTSDLIQAGVNLDATDCTSSGIRYYLFPWWETLPASETPITNWNNGQPATVNIGDSITVTITYVSGGNWKITLADHASANDFFSIQVPYGVPGSAQMPAASAEWIMEGDYFPYYCDILGQGGYCPLAPYSPAVRFSDLGYGTTPLAPYNLDVIDDITMFQDFFTSSPQPVDSVSTVTSLDDLIGHGYGFKVTYTGPNDSVLKTASLVAGKPGPPGAYSVKP